MAAKLVKLDHDWHRKLASKRARRAPAAASSGAREDLILAPRPGRAIGAGPARLEEKLYTVPEAAGILNFEESTIYTWARTGEIRCERFGRNGRSIRIPASALDEARKKYRHG